MTTTSISETTESETMFTTGYSTVNTVSTTILSTVPTASPTNTTILIIYDYYSERRDNYLLYQDGGNKIVMNKSSKNVLNEQSVRTR